MQHNQNYNTSKLIIEGNIIIRFIEQDSEIFDNYGINAKYLSGLKERLDRLQSNMDAKFKFRIVDSKNEQSIKHTELKAYIAQTISYLLLNSSAEKQKGSLKKLIRTPSTHIKKILEHAIGLMDYISTEQEKTDKQLVPPELLQKLADATDKVHESQKILSQKRQARRNGTGERQELRAEIYNELLNICKIGRMVFGPNSVKAENFVLTKHLKRNTQKSQSQEESSETEE